MSFSFLILVLSSSISIKSGRLKLSPSVATRRERDIHKGAVTLSSRNSEQVEESDGGGVVWLQARKVGNQSWRKS